jgi:hypothetical protein
MKVQKKISANQPLKIRQAKSKSECCSPASSSSDSCCPPIAADKDKAPCCGPATVITGGEISEQVPGFIKWLETPAGRVPQISTKLGFSDHLGACKARWAIGRMNYIVPAGLYAIGTPSADSPVLVTANYKMSYDLVRQQLTDRNIWLLVLETFGVNVWCAAGKETFGTDELVSRINRTDLHNVVSHRQLILPILGAPGVAAHQIARRTGFSVKYATIRASDLPEYLDNGMLTTAAMRELTFSTYERLVLVPVEIVLTIKSIATCGSIIFLAAWLANSTNEALLAFVAYLGAVLTGVAAVPILLPWIPGRSFAIKGMLGGIAWSCLLFYTGGVNSWSNSTTAAAFLALPAISAFYALNFTGCTTYTSRSGVKKEMRIGIPAICAAIAASIILLLLNTVMR